jgi:hypothetical protein
MCLGNMRPICALLAMVSRMISSCLELEKQPCPFYQSDVHQISALFFVLFIVFLFMCIYAHIGMAILLFVFFLCITISVHCCNQN